LPSAQAPKDKLAATAMTTASFLVLSMTFTLVVHFLSGAEGRSIL
jgi:hypothetical protein